MELSKRLQAIANLCTVSTTIADIGTDHGYLPIWLIENKKCEKAIAMDINTGPLERAMENITTHQLQKQIETRLSNGLTALKENEVQGVVIAGMGGGLTIRILADNFALVEQLKECILQPQSEIDKVRRYLWENNLCIVQEDMIEEEGKYYPMLRVAQGCDIQGRVVQGLAAPYTEEEFLYGRHLIKDKHPILRTFLQKEIQSKEILLHKLEESKSEKAKKRQQSVAAELTQARGVLERI